MRRLVWCAWVLCLLFSSPLFALRCGHSLVDVGDDKAYVLDVCGEPESVQSHYEKRGFVNRVDASNFNFNGQQVFPNNSATIGQSFYNEIEVLVEDWYYDFGSSRLRKVLRFENGRLREIAEPERRRHRY